MATNIVANTDGGTSRWFEKTMAASDGFPTVLANPGTSTWTTGASPTQRWAVWNAGSSAREYRATGYDDSNNKVVDVKDSFSDEHFTFYCAATGCANNPKPGGAYSSSSNQGRYMDVLVTGATGQALMNMNSVSKGQHVCFYHVGTYGCDCNEVLMAGPCDGSTSSASRNRIFGDHSSNSYPDIQVSPS